MEQWERSTHLSTTVNAIELHRYTVELERLSNMRPASSNDTIILASNLIAPTSWLEEFHNRTDVPDSVERQPLELHFLDQWTNLLSARAACVVFVVITLI